VPFLTKAGCRQEQHSQAEYTGPLSSPPTRTRGGRLSEEVAALSVAMAGRRGQRNQRSHAEATTSRSLSNDFSGR
jgi:hypothetical protein